MNIRAFIKKVIPERFLLGRALSKVEEAEFRKEFQAFLALSTDKQKRFDIRWDDRYPCLGDRTSSHKFDRHYVYHTAWAARVLASNKPDCHIDISSNIYFNAIVSAFVPVKFYDYRPADIFLSNLEAGQANLLALPFSDESINSLSCMHVIEHIGLGRYGDTLDPDGDIVSASELARVLSPGGQLLFVVPVGSPRLLFNAHRIYAYRQVLDLFPSLQLKEFSLIPDNSGRGLIENAVESEADKQRFGCGCFWFIKP